MSNVTMGAGPNINLYGKALNLCSVAIPSLVSQNFKIWTVAAQFYYNFDYLFLFLSIY